MSTTIYKYRLRCISDNKYEYVWAEKPPTTCPTNTAHVIDSAQTVIVEINKSDIVTIKEENVPTGGHFSTRAIKVNAAASVISSHNLTFPHPVSLLSMSFTLEAQHTGDVLNIMPGGKENTIGAITADNVTPTTWASGNYVVGSAVTYLGNTYTCILNTISNEPPNNASYWRRGIELSVSQTVIDNTAIGYFISLDDGVSEQLGAIISIDTAGKKIYVDGAPSRVFVAATPTYVKQTIYFIKDFEMGPVWNIVLGESKIGGSYIPADTPILVEYDNKTASTKSIIGYVEYLY